MSFFGKSLFWSFCDKGAQDGPKIWFSSISKSQYMKLSDFLREVTAAKGSNNFFGGKSCTGVFGQKVAQTDASSFADFFAWSYSNIKSEHWMKHIVANLLFWDFCGKSPQLDQILGF